MGHFLMSGCREPARNVGGKLARNVTVKHAFVKVMFFSISRSKLDNAFRNAVMMYGGSGGTRAARMPPVPPAFENLSAAAVPLPPFLKI